MGKGDIVKIKMQFGGDVIGIIDTIRPDKTINPSDTHIAFPKLTFVYLATISQIISVPPVLKLVL